MRVYVPISLIDLVQKYIGASKSTPQLSKLGTTTWAKKKERVATRGSRPGQRHDPDAGRTASPRAGIAFPADSHWQQEFEAAFPYTETKDQVVGHRRRQSRTCSGRGPWTGCSAATSDTARPKSRCGPRSKRSKRASKWPFSCPRPCSAEQHYRTFSERMAEFPFNVHVLSRFCTKAQQQADPRRHGDGRSGHRRRHASDGAEGRPLQGPGPAGHRRRAAVWRRREGNAQTAAAGSRRADDERHADSADAALVAAWAFATSPT